MPFMEGCLNFLSAALIRRLPYYIVKLGDEEIPSTHLQVRKTATVATKKLDSLA
jgi:hypothetical protein